MGQTSKKILMNADCLEAMKKMPDNCIDAIVTDPPYGLSFMGKNWDHGVPGVEFWKEALRVAKPGAHLLSFGGTRTFHRIACAIEDAGWEVRDCIMWLYGSGFPKSMDISKAIDKKLGAEREKVQGVYGKTSFGLINDDSWTSHKTTDSSIPVSDEAKKWSGWGTCLKPAYEPIIMARKPVEGTIVDNVLKHGTGGINIDECRVPYESGGSAATNPLVRELRGCKNNHGADTGSSWRITGEEGKVGHANMQGRFPANIIHDGSDEVVELFPNTGTSAGGGRHTKGVGDNQQGNAFGSYSGGQPQDSIGYGDSGSAARFFYCAKASKKERNNNCERMLTWEKDQELTQLIEKSNQLLKDISESTMQNLAEIECNTTLFGKDTTEQYQKECKSTISMVIKLITELKTSSLCQHLNTNDYILDVIRMNEDNGISVVQLAEKLNQLMVVSMNDEIQSALNVVNVLLNALVEIRNCAKQGNQHPTVKPIALMEYLVKLVAPENAIVLDPFMGSGTTGVAAVRLGRGFVGIEKEKEYFDIAERRIENAEKKEDKTNEEPTGKDCEAERVS